MSNSEVNGTQNDMNSTSLAQVHTIYTINTSAGVMVVARERARMSSRPGFLRLLNFKLFGVKLANERCHGRVHVTLACTLHWQCTST